MKKIVLNLGEDGNITDDNGTLIVGTTGMNYKFEEFKEVPKVDIEKLMALGATADDLIKLKATGVI